METTPTQLPTVSFFCTTYDNNATLVICIIVNGTLREKSCLCTPWLTHRPSWSMTLRCILVTV